jgi:hypothetical protein
MRKELIGKILVLGIICLFIGVGVQPALAIEPKLSSDNIEIDGDNDSICDYSMIRFYMLSGVVLFWVARSAEAYQSGNVFLYEFFKMLATLWMGRALYFLEMGREYNCEWTEIWDEETISNIEYIENVEDCDCQEEDISNPFMVKLLLSKVEVLTNILMSKYGHIPEIKEKCQELLEIINSNRQLDKSLFPIICAILEDILDIVESINEYVENTFNKVKGTPLFLLVLLLWLPFAIPNYFIYTTLVFLVHYVCGIPWER